MSSRPNGSSPPTTTWLFFFRESLMHPTCFGQRSLEGKTSLGNLTYLISMVRYKSIIGVHSKVYIYIMSYDSRILDNSAKWCKMQDARLEGVTWWQVAMHCTHLKVPYRSGGFLPNQWGVLRIPNHEPLRLELLPFTHEFQGFLCIIHVSSNFPVSSSFKPNSLGN